jgi:hypothetical protein
MQKIFDNRMGASWKISFVLSVFWIGVLYPYVTQWNAWDGGDEIDSSEFVALSLPLTVWLIARWITIGKGADKAG